MAFFQAFKITPTKTMFASCALGMGHVSGESGIGLGIIGLGLVILYSRVFTVQIWKLLSVMAHRPVMLALLWVAVRGPQGSP